MLGLDWIMMMGNNCCVGVRQVNDSCSCQGKVRVVWTAWAACHHQKLIDQSSPQYASICKAADSAVPAPPFGGCLAVTRLGRRLDPRRRTAASEIQPSQLIFDELIHTRSF